MVVRAGVPLTIAEPIPLARTISYETPTIAKVVAPAPRLLVSEAAPANYEFGYAVNDPNTGDSKSQEEIRKGDIVQGRYSLIDSDGTKRTVHYTADPLSGFNAVVSKEPLAIAAAPVARIAEPVAIAQAPELRVASALPATVNLAKIEAPITYAAAAPTLRLAAAPAIATPGISYTATPGFTLRFDHGAKLAAHTLF